MEDRWECKFVEEFVAESTVEALDTAVLRRFSRIDKVLRDSSQSRPFEHLVAGKLAAVIRFQDFCLQTSQANTNLIAHLSNLA